jgi:hypothetical protein
MNRVIQIINQTDDATTNGRTNFNFNSSLSNLFHHHHHHRSTPSNPNHTQPKTKKEKIPHFVSFSLQFFSQFAPEYLPVRLDLSVFTAPPRPINPEEKYRYPSFFGLVLSRVLDLKILGFVGVRFLEEF